MISQPVKEPFLIVFVAYIALSFAFPNESKLPQAPLEMVVYILQNLLLLPGLFDIEPIITVAWSLSYEVFYYLLTPIIIYALKLKSWRVNYRLWLCGSLAVVGMVVLPLVDGPIRLVMFIAGILLFELYQYCGQFFRS